MSRILRDGRRHDRPGAIGRLSDATGRSARGRTTFGAAATLSLLVGHAATAQPPPPTAPSAAETTSAAAVSSDDAAFFEKKIRPVLVAECYGCHAVRAGQEVRGGLALDSPDGLRRGGESGPVVVPGQPAESRLLTALQHVDPALVMPPRKKLADEVVRDFAEWIRRGAPDPRRTPPTTAGGAAGDGHDHWAFQPPHAVAPPDVRQTSWPRSDVDRFILAALEARGLAPVEDADPRTLLRRLSFDLTGLPPTLEELADWEVHGAPSPEQLAACIDRLLASPRFGEKWARHWLDVARYAESTGKTVNFAYPHAWRYRDYVIDAGNADKPYDQFILEQLAGDLLPSDDPRVRAERLIATGFLAIGPKTLNERSGLKFELDLVDEQIDVTMQAFLGLTVACARCHDHKFDPVPQTDYYALAGIFRSTETCYGTVAFINAQRVAPLLPLPVEAAPAVAVGNLTERERQRVEEQLQSVRDAMRRLEDQVQRFLTSGQLSLLQARLDAHHPDGTPKLLAMGVRDKPPGPETRSRRGRFASPGGFTYDGTRAIADSPVYARGEVDQPGSPRVPRGTLQVFGPATLAIPDGTSGRLELARWIASRDNPLTARVVVNRVWLQLFGRGLVPTAGDFGQAGRPPTHPELLDHLARQFMDDGWSLKQLLRTLVLSRTYQLASHSSPQALEFDPDNTLLWRMAPRRLDAEVLRDSLLAVSGQLVTTPPRGSVVARSGEGPVARPRFNGTGIGSAINDPRHVHRSIYLPIIRDDLPEALALFDAADPTLITADRPQTTVPSQALFLLNNALVLRAADATADQLLDRSSRGERIEAAFLRCFGRPPTPAERLSAESFLESFREQLTSNERLSPRQLDRELWSAFCQALLASAEFQYRR